jgi:four helix bundle protein
MKSHKDLEVWKKSIDLVEAVYKLTEIFPKSEQFSLSVQMQRSAISVPSNIAEGSGRMSRGDYIRFLYIARGSLLELDTQIEIANRLGYISNERSERICSLSERVLKMLDGLIFSLKRNFKAPLVKEMEEH